MPKPPEQVRSMLTWLEEHLPHYVSPDGLVPVAEHVDGPAAFTGGWGVYLDPAPRCSRCSQRTA